MSKRPKKRRELLTRNQWIVRLMKPGNVSREGAAAVFQRMVDSKELKAEHAGAWDASAAPTVLYSLDLLHKAGVSPDTAAGTGSDGQ